MKFKTISEIKHALKQKQTVKLAQSGVPSTGPDVKKSYATVPYYTPSDDVDIDNLTEEQKKSLVQKGKLMAGGDPISISKLITRGEALVGKEGKSGKLGGWFSPWDFTYDAGASYKAWIYAWIYLALTITTYVFVHPLVSVIFAWKVGHNWGQYIGALIFGKEDMKGKVIYRTA